VSGAWTKPTDAGTGAVCASFAPDGSWLSIGCLHPRWGFVELNDLPPFDETERGDPTATRRYRTRMTDPHFAWLRVENAGPAARAGPAVGAPGSHRLVQHWEVDPSLRPLVRVTGRIDRPPLAEITEIDPPGPTGATTTMRAEGSRLVVQSAELPALATVEVTTGRWSVQGTEAALQAGPGARSLDIAVTLVPDAVVAEARTHPRTAASRPEDGPDAEASGIGRIVEGSLAYVRSCTALVLAPGERPFLTDHRLLPLSWTRDAYYQALLLLGTGSASDSALVADHLRWLWRRCERPGGRWLRSHHGNGTPKDRAFQADQQLYPFVELADLWRRTHELPDGVDWARHVPEAWQVVLEDVDPVCGLIRTDENAADDRVEAPFVAGSQILLWYAAGRLAELAAGTDIGLRTGELRATAERARIAFGRHFVRDGRWVYATDGRGGSVDYHDANEFPTVLAPFWGFCAPDDPAWRATLAWAFSPANAAYVDGLDGGLGSRHTPGTWPLGHVQAWLAATIIQHRARAEMALARLADAAFSDGLLPEAVQHDTSGRRAVRHWFAWPGAALGAFWQLERTRAWDTLAVGGTMR